MQPLNPFLASFFKPGSPIVTQCTPVHHHILLVPTTEFFLTSRETESGLSLSDIVGSEDFLGSHVLRVPSPATAAGGKDTVGNLREQRGKPKQYSTLNGRSVVIKDNFVYSNKGFKTLAQAQLLNDSVWYADSIEPRQWLIYYISRPLIGIWADKEIPRAIFIEGMAKRKLAEAKQAAAIENGEPSLPRKKEIQSFHDLLNHFPMIARQMQPGLEKLFREFTTIFERPLPPPPSATHIPDPLPDGPIVTAMKRARSNSLSARRNSLEGQESESSRPTENFYAEDDEDVMRASLETAVTNAIDLFQSVDKQQLSMLGATTELTGPVVERLIERYVSESVHNLIWPRLAAMRRPDDLELEAKIRQMEFIDISQLGIFIEGGPRAKHELTFRLGHAVDEFRKMTSSMSPQEMMEILLSTMKAATQLTEQPQSSAQPNPTSEKPTITVNADTLVSLLLFVLIRSGVKHLQARLIYIKHFVFIDDVDSGEIGYALSTFEAVLQYLSTDSSSLRRASRRNKALWDAAKRGDMDELKRMMDPDTNSIDEEHLDSPISGHAPSVSWSMVNGSSRRSSAAFTPSESYSQGSGLSHVFPFQSQATNDSSAPSAKRIKRVSMDTRSMSSGSEYSYHSRAGSVVTLGSGLEGDTSIERLCQTEDAFGESIPMMAVQNERAEVLKYLLSLDDYFPANVILDDCNNEGTSLLSAAVQLGNTELIDAILDFVVASSPEPQIRNYLSLQDSRGRSVAHYLFHAPSLIARIGKLLPWRQKDKNGQTPLFALCRSYDHQNYHDMVEAGLEVATHAQGDNQPLHLDQHVDSKGNTLLHIINDHQLAVKILIQCDIDVNATNDKKFTALMVASKYGRFEMVRAMYSDPRVDVYAKELRGLTAVELAKDDDVRNKIDDLTLFTMPPAEDGRITGVVRSFFVEDATIRLVLKSGAPVDHESYTVTTCRRSFADFERLANLLSVENPASWIPKIISQRSPFQIPSKPSRAVLKDLQIRTDSFLKILLAHPTFATHEMLWEFFLVPDVQTDMIEQRSRLKAATRAEKVRDEFEPLEDIREVEQFVDHARDMVRSVNYSTKSVARRANAIGVVTNDFYDAASEVSREVANLAFVPPSHISAFEAYVYTLIPPQSNPSYLFHNSFLAVQSTIQAMLASLSRPPQLVTQIVSCRKAIERNYNSVSRSTRWPLGLLDETRQRINEDREEKARRAQTEVDTLSKELRYTQQTVASELAGWEEMHERMGRKAIREFARGMLILERERLQGLRRAQRKLQDLDLDFGNGPQGSGVRNNEEGAVIENGVGKDPAEGESSTSGEAFVDRVE
ncbi:VPS9 domain-containing protein [Annulohypoxylon truncatum]|uniref:VPS9 domain-containing protein n=1 Tax=Annulohypoxylon truncatum TaxID=327061 RepID=UPI0020073032|nr:VPS9 domain-containing protein [Annulohypoxylon truncatum]KAI1209399.1 VPS9 domain-containing protein [Annulohypoxylon truncatum]